MYDVRAKTASKNPLDKFAKISTKDHFTRIGVSIWNSIPLSVKTLNMSNFRKK